MLTIEILETCRSRFNSPAQDTQTAVTDAISLYKAAAAAIKELQDIQSEAKARLTEVMIETAVMDWTTPAGRVYVPAPGVSVSYDHKALDTLCKSDPTLAALLRPLRRETERAGSMTIR